MIQYNIRRVNNEFYISSNRQVDYTLTGHDVYDNSERTYNPFEQSGSYEHIGQNRKHINED